MLCSSSYQWKWNATCETLFNRRFGISSHKQVRFNCSEHSIHSFQSRLIDFFLPMRGEREREREIEREREKSKNSTSFQLTFRWSIPEPPQEQNREDGMSTNDRRSVLAPLNSYSNWIGIIWMIFVFFFSSWISEFGSFDCSGDRFWSIWTTSWTRKRVLEWIESCQSILFRFKTLSHYAHNSIKLTRVFPINKTKLNQINKQILWSLHTKMWRYNGTS
jgi:hypothetical protein